MWCSPPTWWCASPPERDAGGPSRQRGLAPPSRGCFGARPGIRTRLRARMSGARRRVPNGRTGCPRGRRGTRWWYVVTVRWAGVSGPGGSRAATRAPVVGTPTRRRFRTVRHEHAPVGESGHGLRRAVRCPRAGPRPTRGGRTARRAPARFGPTPSARPCAIPGHPGSRAPRRGRPGTRVPCRGRRRAARVLRRPCNCRMAVSPPCFWPRAPTGPRCPVTATRR